MYKHISESLKVRPKINLKQKIIFTGQWDYKTRRMQEVHDMLAYTSTCITTTNITATAATTTTTFYLINTSKLRTHCKHEFCSLHLS